MRIVDLAYFWPCTRTDCPVANADTLSLTKKIRKLKSEKPDKN